MRTSPATLLVLVAAIAFSTTAVVDAQETATTLPTLPAADTGTTAVDPAPTPLPPETEVALPPSEPVTPPTDSTPTVPELAPWTWQHQTQNQQGTVTNLHEQMRMPDGSAYSYQHSVTRPNGSHTQLREYSQTEEGYQLMRQQRFYKPDGTLLREQSMTVTGADPYNYQRQMTHTFRDGRTMEKTFTRSYDGTTGTMERSFVGPNGQVHQFERPWTPNDLADVGTPIMDPIETPIVPEAELPTTDELGAVSSPTVDPLVSVASEPAGTDVPPIVDPLAPTTTETDEGFLSRLNPFKNRERKRSVGSSANSRRSGFTIGSFGRSRRMDSMPPGQARKASGLSNASTLRSMNSKIKQTGPPAHAAASLPSKAGKKF